MTVVHSVGNEENPAISIFFWVPNQNLDSDAVVSLQAVKKLPFQLFSANQSLWIVTV